MTTPYKIILETPRLVLRVKSLKIWMMWVLYQNPNITKYIPDAPRSREEAKEELEWHMNGHPKNLELGLWATIHKATGKFIGRCGLLPREIDGRMRSRWHIRSRRRIRVRGWGVKRHKRA